MKTLKTLVILACIVCANNYSFSQTEKETEQQGALLVLSPNLYEYGDIDISNIPSGKLTIEFTNNGTQPLIVSNVRGCCGSSILEWTQGPIMPGQTGSVTVQLRIPRNPGAFGRTVTFTSNSSDNSQHVYRITGRIVDPSAVE